MSRQKVGTIRVDSTEVRAAIKKARRDVNRNVRTGIKSAVEQSALPHAQRKAPSLVRSNVAAGAQSGRGYLTFKGKGRLRDAGALLNFGGNRREIIRPKNAKALKTPWGPRALIRMSGSRYEGKHFLEKGAEAGLPQFAAIVMKHVDRALEPLD